jgi:hypothetical protein
MRVRFARLGAGVVEVDVPAGSTVGDAAEKAGIDLEGTTLRADATDILTPSSPLPAGDNVFVTVAAKVEGGI